MAVPKNKEEMTVEWFNKIFGSENRTVIAVTWKGNANNGLGALSSLERVNLSLQQEGGTIIELSVIIKNLPIDPNVREYVTKTGFASREVNMYCTVLPEMEKFLKERGISETEFSEYKFRHPKCYFGAENQAHQQETDENYNMILILEDMFTSGFELWKEGPYEILDWDRTCAALKQIALFHAVTFAYRTVHGIQNYLDIYPFLLDFNKDDPDLDGYLDGGMDTVKKIFKDMENAGETIPVGLLELLESQKSKVLGILREIVVPKPGRIFTICHNDLHTYNVFFNYQRHSDSGIQPQASWADFQACFEGPPMKDVTFFLLTCCDFSLSSTKMSETVEFYHGVFSDALIKMKVNATYSLEQMKNDFECNLMKSIWHVIAGTKYWCVRPEFAKRLKEMLIGSFEMGLLKYPLNDNDNN